MTVHKIPLAARGDIIEDYALTFKGRHGSEFAVPDPAKYLSHVLLPSRRELNALYTLSIDDIIDFLIELGKRLDVRTNPHLRWALDLNGVFSDMPRHLSEFSYSEFMGDNGLLSRASLEAAVNTVGREYLEGWYTTNHHTGRVVGVRAVGVPTVHVVAGNAPGVTMMTFARNALIRGYAIVKIPSNELGAAIALARTLHDMAPDHPLTKSWSALYWKGGDEAFESKLYHPRHIDRIVAWGGFASVKHIAKYVRPGLDLITFDPKISRAVLGPEALQDEGAMNEAARRLAADVGYLNQIGCASARLAYVRCDTDAASLAKLKSFAEKVYAEIQALPAAISSAATHMDSELAAKIEALEMLDDDYHVIGGDKRGGVIVSLNGEQVEFADDLNHRIVNIVPIPDYDTPLRLITRDVQTVGVYPESLRDELRLPFALAGVQRLTSLGYMLDYQVFALPHDGNEALRRMATWVMSEDCLSNSVPTLWK